MPNKTLVSVIIPLFNSANYIKKLINNILSSSSTEFEVIVVNDGSTDDSYRVVKSISDDRLIIINKNNEGTYISWQKGFMLSKGEYIIIFDSDDYVDKDWFDVAKNVISLYSPDCFLTPYLVEDEDGNPLCNSYTGLDDGLYCGERLENIRNKLCSGEISCSKANKFIKRSFYENAIHNKCVETIKDFEDWLTIIPIFAKIQSLFVDNKPFYHYVQHNNSVTHSTKSYVPVYESFEKVLCYLSDNSFKLNINNDNFASVSFYGLLSIFNRAFSIYEKSLMKIILKRKDFQSGLYNFRCNYVKKMLMRFRAVNLLIFFSKIKHSFGRS